MSDSGVHQGAKLYARWLALEIAVKYAEEIEPGLAEQNLSARLGVPIMEAHQRYRDALEDEEVLGSGYFETALNEILGRGEEIF